MIRDKGELQAQLEERDRQVKEMKKAMGEERVRWAEEAKRDRETWRVQERVKREKWEQEKIKEIRTASFQ